MRNLIWGGGANDIRQKRTLLSSIAVAIIIIGFLLLSAVPMTAKPPTSNPVATTRESTQSIEQADSTSIDIKDYSEFGSEPMSDLPSSDWLGLLVSLVFKLGLVIALIYLTIRLLRIYIYRGKVAVSGPKPVSLLGSLTIAPQGSVHLIEVGRKVLVVGATQSQMSLLSEITDPAEIGEVRAQCAETPPVDQFLALVNAAKRRFGDRNEQGETEGSKSASQKD
jgi:flagellar biogenesis protein FliO